MRTLFSFVFLLAAFFFISGMGANPPGVEGAVKNNVKISVTVIDDQGISTKCSNVVWDGEPYFKGKRGKGTVTIPFEKVRKASRVGDAGERKVDFQITLKSGDVIAVTFDAEARFQGTTVYGAYMIPAQNIKDILFE